MSSASPDLSQERRSDGRPGLRRGTGSRARGSEGPAVRPGRESVDRAHYADVARSPLVVVGAGQQRPPILPGRLSCPSCQATTAADAGRKTHDRHTLGCSVGAPQRRSGLACGGILCHVETAVACANGTHRHCATPDVMMGSWLLTSGFGVGVPHDVRCRWSTGRVGVVAGGTGQGRVSLERVRFPGVRQLPIYSARHGVCPDTAAPEQCSLSDIRGEHLWVPWSRALRPAVVTGACDMSRDTTRSTTILPGKDD